MSAQQQALSVGGNIMRAFFQIIIILILFLMSCNNQRGDTPKKYGDLTDVDYKKDTLKIDGEEVPTKIATTENEPQLKTDFTSQDKTWLAKNLENARELKNEYWEKPMPKEKEFMPHVLDEVFEQWMTDTSKTKKDADFVTNSCGAAFGQYLVDNYNMKWIIVKDDYGTDYAVIHKKWNIIAYPPSSVRKGIEQDKRNFFSSIELTVKQQIKDGDKGDVEGNK
jgi:hypothetical protein